ncbi:5-formyltetrahydrofolate cyclo-ligase [Skermania piniformis]|uniref:5-formyltetrahydrofolate cyclo-ligase n=1 Tax=Skermania pinensis TaxID=39122 RepID=A0ABX8SBX2_9ACTN|nr:5-formyltetrahydrofolate cyclo-ligase [Skermania piniformis]QXQ13201.1 5-formyltetrahydrofolate cyclo-ligase [Skermania piniformis]
MTGTDEPSAKQLWREQIITARRCSTDAEHAIEAGLLAVAASALVTAGSNVCAYVPIGREPGLPTLLDALRDAGAQVLLPVTGRPGPLTWSTYLDPDHLVRTDRGLYEPTGPRLAATAIRTAELILVPALAADRRGVRLGRGAGYYDRSLPLADPAARIVAVVRDDELVPELPADPHDRRVGWALCPHAGAVRLDHR